MQCIYKPQKCVLSPLHSIIGYFQDKKSCFSSPLFAQLQAIKMPDFYIGYTPSVGKPKTEQEILKNTQDMCYPLHHYLSRKDFDTFPFFKFSNFIVS